MAKSVALEIGEEGLREALNGLLKKLLAMGVVDALLVPLKVPAGNSVVQALVTQVDMLKDAYPLAPVMPVNSARIISSMTRLSSSEKKIGVVIRPCELRALVELVKLKQASTQNMLLIGIDCFGTMSVNEYDKFAQEHIPSTAGFLKLIGENSIVREACQVCEYFSPLTADITIGLIGMDLSKEILILANTAEGEEVLQALGMEGEADSGVSSRRDEAISQLSAEREKKRDEFFERTNAQVYGLEKLLTTLSLCIGCHNCRDVCPMCYCKECFIDSPTFEWGADKYLEWATKKGALRMPTDTLLFHLTRLQHMVTSCVGCGMCQEACPNDLPVFGLFRMVGSKVQKVFDYVPGRSVEDELPLVIYKERELEWLTNY